MRSLCQNANTSFTSAKKLNIQNNKKDELNARRDKAIKKFSEFNEIKKKNMNMTENSKLCS